MNRKRVLVFTETALALSETFIAAHCRSLQQYEYRLVALYRSGEHHGDVRRHLLFPSGKPNAFARLAFRLGYNRQLDTLIEAFQPDIIHAHYLTNGAILAPYAGGHGVPLIITVHGHDALRILRKGSVYDQLYRLQRRRLTRHTATLLPVSNFLRERLLAGGFLPERTRTHYLGIELPSTPPASPASNPPHIVFVGRLVAKKGLDVVLRAFAMVRSARPDAELHIVGEYVRLGQGPSSGSHGCGSDGGSLEHRAAAGPPHSGLLATAWLDGAYSLRRVPGHRDRRPDAWS
jgi:glycosyltransferase involved in cell wall biosynthesis